MSIGPKLHITQPKVLDQGDVQLIRDGAEYEKFSTTCKHGAFLLLPYEVVPATADTTKGSALASQG